MLNARARSCAGNNAWTEAIASRKTAAVQGAEVDEDGDAEVFGHLPHGMQGVVVDGPVGVVAVAVPADGTQCGNRLGVAFEGRPLVPVQRRVPILDDDAASMHEHIPEPGLCARIAAQRAAIEPTHRQTLTRRDVPALVIPESKTGLYVGIAVRGTGLEKFGDRCRRCRQLTLLDALSEQTGSRRTAEFSGTP